MTPNSTECGSEDSDEGKPLPVGGKRILVVDDEEGVAKSLKMILAKIGHTVEIAENAELALRLLANAEYDLIITDFALGMMTGLDLARTVKSKRPSQPIILITAYAESLSLGNHNLSDFVAVLGKPFSLEELLGAIATIFRG